MVLESLSLTGFRNLKEVDIYFAPDRNLLWGENGAGKTNLLEAIYYLSMGKSFRKAGDDELIRFDGEFFRLEGDAKQKAMLFYSAEEKKFLLDGVEMKRLADFIGWMPAVIFSLEDIWLVRGVPSERRYYLDMAIAKISRNYLADLIEYRKIVRQRNRILEELRDNNGPRNDQDEYLLSTFDEELVRLGNGLYKKRREYFDFMVQHTVEICHQMQLDSVEIIYRSMIPDMKMEVAFLERRREREIGMGKTLYGPHRDDIILNKQGRALKTFGSEGEQRIMALALRLAEVALVERIKAESAIKLLDETVAELDANRRKLFFDNLQGQIFFATTSRVDNFGKHFTIENGEIKKAG